MGGARNSNAFKLSGQLSADYLANHRTGRIAPGERRKPAAAERFPDGIGDSFPDSYTDGHPARHNHAPALGPKGS